MYILSTGCQWAALPKDPPPRSTVNDYLRRWDDDRTLDRIHHAFYVQCRELAAGELSSIAQLLFKLGVSSSAEWDRLRCGLL
jgi:transposase